jgi:DNA-binding PadR family transcriptional regulator
MPPRTLGFATVSILQAIRSGRRYGLDIMDETGLGGGTIYKLLHRVEQKGLVVGAWEDPEVAERERRPRRRYYRLTSEGEGALTEALRRFGSLASATGQAHDREVSSRARRREPSPGEA